MQVAKSRKMSVIHIVLPSGDINAVGDRANFTIPLSSPLMLENSSQWECALVACSYPAPAGASAHIYHVHYVIILELGVLWHSYYIGPRRLV